MIGYNCNQVGLVQPCFDRRVKNRVEDRTTRAGAIKVEKTERAILTNIKCIVLDARTIGPEDKSTTATTQNCHLHFISEVTEVRVLSKTCMEILRVLLVSMIRPSFKLAKTTIRRSIL